MEGKQKVVFKELDDNRIGTHHYYNQHTNSDAQQTLDVCLDESVEGKQEVILELDANARENPHCDVQHKNSHVEQKIHVCLEESAERKQKMHLDHRVGGNLH